MPENWLLYLWEQTGINWYKVPVIVLSAVTVYLVFLLLVRVFGPRVITPTNGFDALVILMLGSVCGRAILGTEPTVLAGVVALATLLSMEAAFGAVERALAEGRAVRAARKSAEADSAASSVATQAATEPAGEGSVDVAAPGKKRGIGAKPVLVFAHGKPVDEGCRKTKTSAADLASVMRRAGVANPSDVQCIILEPQGVYSLMREGQRLDPLLFAGVQGAEKHLRFDSAS